MQITENFTLDEFRCRDAEKTPYPYKWIDERLFPLCIELEKIRKKIGRPIFITSGYRTKAYNAQQPRASKNSLHIVGMAVDFKCLNKSGVKKLGARELYQIVSHMIDYGELKNGGLGSYPRHIHYDLGPKNRRWKE